MKNKLSQLLKENSRLEKTIKNKYSRDTLTDIVVYLRSSSISQVEQELIRQDIINMILDGENEGRKLDDIIGSDYKSFCDSVIEEVPKLNPRQKLYENISASLLSLSVLLAVLTIFELVKNIYQHKDLFLITITNGYILTMLVVVPMSFYIFDKISKNSFDKTKKVWLKQLLPLYTCSIIIIVFNTFMAKDLFTAYLPYLLVLILALFILSKIIYPRSSKQ